MAGRNELRAEENYHYQGDECSAPGEIFSPGFRAVVQLGSAAFIGYAMKHSGYNDTGEIIAGTGTMGYFVIKGGLNATEGVARTIRNVQSKAAYHLRHQ